MMSIEQVPLTAYRPQTRVLAISLDNVCRSPKNKAKFIDCAENQIILPRVAQQVANYSRQGWKIVGICNPEGVQQGYVSFDECIAIQKQTLAQIPRMNMLLFCPDQGVTCYCLFRHNLDNPLEKILFCKKWQEYGNFQMPNPGMVNFARQYWWNHGDMPNILVVGNGDTDRLTSVAAQSPFMWAEQWHHTNDNSTDRNVPDRQRNKTRPER